MPRRSCWVAHSWPSSGVFDADCLFIHQLINPPLSLVSIPNSPSYAADDRRHHPPRSRERRQVRAPGRHRRHAQDRHQARCALRLPHQVRRWQVDRLLRHLRQRGRPSEVRAQAPTRAAGTRREEGEEQEGTQGGEEQGQEDPRYRSEHRQAQGEARRPGRLREGGRE